MSGVHNALDRTPGSVATLRGMCQGGAGQGERLGV